MNAFIGAARLRTLPLAISGILMGSACAWLQHDVKWEVMGLGLITAVLLQVLSNFANDYGDFAKGTDKAAARKDRALASGALQPAQMKKAIWITAVLAFISGIALLYFALPKIEIEFLAFLILGILAIGAAIRYTIGKKAYGYRGLGDIFVLIFFGIVAVDGIYFLHTGVLELPMLLPALCVGLLSTGVLNVNNIRDIAGDKKSGKITLPVRLGKKKALRYHSFLVIFGLTALILFFILFRMQQEEEIDIKIAGIILAVFLPFLVFLSFHMSALRAAEDRPAYNAQLKQLSMITLALSAYTWILAFLLR